MDKYIKIRGAREHNLKNINLDIPREKLIVVTGLSGSGKSSLAFDTVYVEGQRRYVESFSTHARQYMEQLEKPDVDSIEGLSPAVSVDQKTTGHNPRSTVGTVTEINDYLRLLYARVGEVHCPKCGKILRSMSIDQMIDQIYKYPSESRLYIYAPIVRRRKGSFANIFDNLQQKGFVRVKIDDKIYTLGEHEEPDKRYLHNISILVDRMVLRENNRSRLAESLEIALQEAKGSVDVEVFLPEAERESDSQDDGREIKKSKLLNFSQNMACSDCNISISELSHRIFSFNNPLGACPQCAGLGNKLSCEPEAVVQFPEKSINDGAIDLPGFKLSDRTSWSRSFIEALAEEYHFSLDTPFNALSPEIQKIILYGDKSEKLLKIDTSRTKFAKTGGDYYRTYPGIIPTLERRYAESSSPEVKEYYEKFMTVNVCEACHGARLKAESLAVKIGDKNIHELSCLSISECREYLRRIFSNDESEKYQIASRILKELDSKLSFLIDIGLDYMTLARSATTLSGGEAQRMRLATQIASSSLTGVLYVLDEPSIGLHQRDNSKLLRTLKKIRDAGNTVLVVEHDFETMEEADFIVDIGPLAGSQGGEVVAVGSLADIMAAEKSVTGQYLAKKKQIPIPHCRRKNNKYLTIAGAAENNLKNIDVSFPLSCFSCLTGVSGSGKSSLLNGILIPFLETKINKSRKKTGKFKKITGYEHLNKLISIDQSPIGRTPRSNPATYTGTFDLIRNIFSQTKQAKAKGYQPGRFSFNVKGGRCESCCGDGVKRIEMHFLPDVFVKCEQCQGKRYNYETLQIKYKDKNIYEVLEMTVDEAYQFFEEIPAIRHKLSCLQEVGLGYIKLGQNSTGLSGGEAQRVKLANELSKKSTGKTLYVLDEPTTGLHIADVHKLVDILQRLADLGNTIIVIEHNLDLIKSCDYIVDLGPEGGEQGGQVVAVGTPEEVAVCESSYTAQYLKDLL